MNPDPFERLNPAQRAAVMHGDSPLLVIAGAGTGKTSTLAHRVTSLLLRGTDPRRILLLTFTRRAADELTRRAARTAQGQGPAMTGSLSWSGTFHSVANRLLRLHAESVGLSPSFTVLDRSDSADLMDLVRTDLGLAKKDRRFPTKSTCVAIYSRVVNTQRPLGQVLETAFPWCVDWEEDLTTLFGAYTEAKQRRQTLDYDDLLLYWFHMVDEPALARHIGARFDHVLVDEYQDTNALQAGILLALKPDGHGVTVVGDDAQAIYSFRAATVDNILGFPKRFDPPATVVILEQNYRSTQPILDAANEVIALAERRYRKDLFSTRPSPQKPALVTTDDETTQVEFVIERILEHREAGVDLRRQAVLFRTSHHSDLLEVELHRRNIPFVKYGGLKFLEAAHVKDVLCALRWAENPRDEVAAARVLKLLPGIGPGHARRAFQHLEEAGFDPERLAGYRPPASAAEDWPKLVALLADLRTAPWPSDLGRVRRWYQPHLERRHDAPAVRAGDLEELERLAVRFPSRERFLSELTLDPPSATGDEAGPPHLDDDFLILSTIHSAKGMEWDAVYVLNAADGCIPSDMATGSAEEIEEERRLLYVALTRARDALYVIHPKRFYVRGQDRLGDRHVLAPVSRFLPPPVRERFETIGHARPIQRDEAAASLPRVDVAARLAGMWRQVQTK